MSMSSSQSNLVWTEVTKKPPKNVILQTTSSRRQSPNEIETKKNNRDQLRLNNDVIVFAKKAEKGKQIKKFKIPKEFSNKVTKTEEIKDKTGAIHLTITFKDQATKAKMIKESRSFQNFTIRERLTKFNTMVQRVMKSLLNMQLICGLYRADCHFEVKLDENSPWIAVTCESVFNKVVKEANEAAKRMIEDEKRENKEEQLKLHRRIILSEIPLKTAINEAAIVKNFATICGLKVEDFEKFFMLNDHVKMSRELHIDFKEKSNQLKIINKEIKLNELLGNNFTSKTIKVIQPLTNFNREVLVKLKTAMKNKKIETFELYDQRFRYKINKNSKWAVITYRQEIKNIP